MPSLTYKCAVLLYILLGVRITVNYLFLQIFGTVGVQSQWWCTSMVALTWKALEIYMMGVSWQAMAMWSSSQSTIGLGYLVRYLLRLSPCTIKNVIALFCFLLCFLMEFFEPKVLNGSMRSLNVHTISTANLGKIQICSRKVIEALIV